MKSQSESFQKKSLNMVARFGRGVTASFVLVALVAMSVSSASAETFRRTKMIDAKGKEQPVDLAFDADARLLTVKSVGEPIFRVPYDSIQKLSYEVSSRHRIREGAVVMIFSLGAGGVIMLTKSKSHWFYVDYKAPAGEARTLTLKLDKKEYKRVLATAGGQIGQSVETLAPLGHGVPTR